MHQTGIIILAAGNSSRLGRPKQLLPFDNKLLVQHAVDVALQAKPGAVVVVTGAGAAEVSAALLGRGATIICNKNWPEGMASGIVAGLENLLQLDNAIKNILISVCDQPYVSAPLFITLLEKKRETGKGIIACAYAGTLGTPVLFDRKYTKDLLQLKGKEGAKSLVRNLEKDVATVNFTKGSIDIDTEEDYSALLSLFNSQD
ncbi:MAG: nucleotidyltransferase family protein [Chitinophagaceae bacterium]